MAQVKSYRYAVVDVFTAEPLAGNPLAVFPGASEFDETTMQKIARELNLAETAFVLPATREDCVARVRIFTPAKELAFAGHPTIGTAFVLFQEETISRNSSEFSLGEEVGPSRFELKEASARSYSRMFAPEYGVPEDPATGSSTGPLAVFMMRHHFISKAGAA